MLEIKQLALYWNTNAQENWTQNREFVNERPAGDDGLSKQQHERQAQLNYQRG